MKRILIALTSHAALGDTGQTTGNYLSDLTHSYFVFEQAGYPVELASIQGGEPPVVEASIKLDDPHNKRFYERVDIVAALRNTPRIADLRATDYQAIFLVGGMEPCGIFRAMGRWSASPPPFTNRAALYLLSVT